MLLHCSWVYYVKHIFICQIGVVFLEYQDTNGVALHLNSFFTYVSQLFDISSFIPILEDILELYFVCLKLLKQKVKLVLPFF